MCPMRIGIATYYPYVYLCICVLVLCKHLFVCICVQPRRSQCILSIIRNRKQTKYDTKVKFQINQINHMYMCRSCSCCQNTLIHEPYTHIYVPYIYTYMRLQKTIDLPFNVYVRYVLDFLLINEVFILQSLANVYYIYVHTHMQTWVYEFYRRLF